MVEFILLSTACGLEIRRLVLGVPKLRRMLEPNIKKLNINRSLST